MHTLSPNFFMGVSDQNENLVGKFFARFRRAKKAFPFPKFFDCGGLFRCGGTEKALKTVKNNQKKDPKNFFDCGSLFYETLVGRFNEIGRTKEGGQKF